METNIDALRIRRTLGRSIWAPPQPYDEWVHASVSRPDRMPDYDDLKLVHGAVFGAGWAYQVFTPPADHINIHEYCLHLFGRLDGAAALPDFAYGSGTI